MTNTCGLCGNLFSDDQMIKSRYACKPCWRGYVRQRRYGITSVDFAKLMKKQRSRCAICGEADSLGKSLAVDHNKDTGVIRGLLCGRCNRGIGYFSHDTEMLRKAAKYVA